MNYWILTDTHFGHAAMKKLCGRPEGFEQLILNQVAHKVKQDDVLIHLGDFCLGEDSYWNTLFYKYCPGLKWLIRGNHDKKSNTWYHKHGWDFVADHIMLRVFGASILLSHKPLEVVPVNHINVHGHHHNTGNHPEDKVDGRHRLVYIEHDYTPVSLRSLVEGIKNG